MVTAKNAGASKPQPVPRSWSAFGKWAVNAVLRRIGWMPPFKLSRSELRDAPRWQLRVEGFWRTFVHDTNFWLAALLFGGGVAALLLWKSRQADLHWSDLWSELGGMTLDVFVILIVFEYFQHRRSVKAEADRQRETIDDYKAWDSEEARFKIAGAIRRLNRFGITAVDLAGATLTDFSFPRAGIRSLAGSTFYDGTWGDPHRETAIQMTRVDFGHLDCSRVKFSPFEPLRLLANFHHAKFLDCNFQESDFAGATFNGAELAWTNIPPEAWEIVEEDEDGEPRWIPTGYGPFHGASLKDACFHACAFRNADFRGADDLRGADFSEATGLEQAFFDSPGDKAWAIAAAGRKS